MDNPIGMFFGKHLVSAILGAISAIVVISGILFIQDKFLGGVINAGPIMFLGWGISWMFWFSTINFFMDRG